MRVLFVDDGIGTPENERNNQFNVAAEEKSMTTVVGNATVVVTCKIYGFFFGFVIILIILFCFSFIHVSRIKKIKIR